MLQSTQNGPNKRQTFDRLGVPKNDPRVCQKSVGHWVHFVGLRTFQNAILLCIWAPWEYKVSETMHEKHQTNGRLRMPKTFAESVENLPDIGAILEALARVWKRFPLILIPQELANET